MSFSSVDMQSIFHDNVILVLNIKMWFDIYSYVSIQFSKKCSTELPGLCFNKLCFVFYVIGQLLASASSHTERAEIVSAVHEMSYKDTGKYKQTRQNVSHFW